MKEEEGFLGCALGVVLEKLEALFQEDHIHFLQVKIRGNHARTIIA